MTDPFDAHRREEHLEVVNGVELFFEDTGPVGAPAVLYLHGGPGYNSFSFQDLAGEFLTGYRVVYLDQRATGRSGLVDSDPALFTIDALVGDALAVMGELGIESFTPVGHAFGAVLALECARVAPTRVPRVVVVNPWLHFPELASGLYESAWALSGNAGRPTPPEAPEERANAAFALLGGRNLLAELHFPTAASRMRLEFSDAASGLMASGEAQEGFLVNGLWELEYPAYLAEVRAQTTVIVGTLDATSYPSQTDWLVDLAAAKLLTLEAGHYPWVDDVEAFAGALLSSLPPLESN